MLRVALTAASVSALIAVAGAAIAQTPPVTQRPPVTQNPNDNPAVSEAGKGSVQAPTIPGKQPPSTTPSTSMPNSRLPGTKLPTSKTNPVASGPTGADAGKGAAGLSTPPPTIPSAPGDAASSTPGGKPPTV